MAANPCTPNTLLSTTPCFQCLSQRELMGVLILALAVANGNDMPDDLDALMSNSACNVCMTDKQMIEGVVTIFASYYLSDLTMDEIQAKIKCMLCADNHRLKALLTFLICSVYQPVV